MSDSKRAHLSADALLPKDRPITAPLHTWFTSPARSHSNLAQAKELPLHLIQLILTHLDDVGDLARITRTSRLFYYMTLPRLYEKVTLRSYADIRYVDGRPEGYGNGSPFAMGLNTLVSRNFSDYIQSFRVIGDWRDHDVDDYKQGRVPDNSMILQIVMRAALDKMKNLKAFAWELSTPPLSTVYQGITTRTLLASLTIRCPSRRTPRPTTIIPPLPNLTTLVVYDIDPLCYPDDISLLLAGSKKLENLKLHWSPRMRAEGEESVSLHSMFGRCLAARYAISIKRLAIYNVYTRFSGDDFHNVMNHDCQTEITVINSMGSSDPMTVFADDSWRVHNNHPTPRNLKMIRIDNTDKEGVIMLGKFKGLERLYIVNNRRGKEASPKSNSTAATPTTPSTMTPGVNCNTSASNTPNSMTQQRCRSLGSEFLAVIQTNHNKTIRHLLLNERWVLSDDALFRLCQLCPNLEQLGFACGVPPLESLRQVFTLVPKLWAVRFLARPTYDTNDPMGDDDDPMMHAFALATEFWRPEYKNVKYIGYGDNIVFKLGGVYFPPKGKEPVPNDNEKSMNAKRAGPKRKIDVLRREDVKDIEIWGLDTTEFDPKFP
ncbi:hypothetical protein GT037_001809 [Alternaria burnsii]|uniref:F-box domain-containing protein n=1 Tax=Alternaria burnsii TaxID=1187904 RepID=A0A8H7BEX0_9PLEO|nr:uncharacterized protein GT037_001809 [Alternaria burnsii]KAF7680158.1 hypothetical protein GT037_001809 [Alternaria burnsii]